MKKLTVILPCLNVVLYIKKCIDSIVGQTIFVDLEVLIIDAGSTDGTYEIAYWYAQNYENIELLNSEKKSYGYQVNTCIKRALGKYIAILETDDFVRQDMYEVLYGRAEENQADYVKADFTMFFERKNGCTIDWNIKISQDEKCYNRIVDPSKSVFFHLNDFSIWKGIYNREFLINNNIFLYESKGAAYQDIGFGQLLHSKTRRAYYIDDYLYRYRIGREGASVNSGKGIQFAHDEFKRLLELPDAGELYLPGVYHSMFSSLLGEFSLITDPYVFFNNNELQNGLEWMVNSIDEGFDRGIISSNDFSKDSLEEFYRIKENPYEIISERMNKRTDALNKYLSIKFDGLPHVIFGAGTYGKNALMLFDSYGIRVDYFLDNAAESTDHIGGLQVMLPTSGIVSEKVKYIIANKKHKEEIKKQLVRLGADENNLIDYGW